VGISFAAAGAKIHILDVNRETAASAAREITSHGGFAEVHECDVSDSAQVNATIGKLQSIGGVDILVNNAGVSHIGDLEATSEEEFERIFSINVKGVFHCMRACIGLMKERGHGVILNMASIASSAGISERFAYSMSKGAVLSMTMSVARDYVQHNIRCNCISPARVHTPFVDRYLERHYPGQEQEMFNKLANTQPIGRMGTPDEIASLVLYLCSDEASFITGANYLIDGGFVNLRG
jgi:NAD(P)-dependent dehydrogenase (short-subunit alcohol dehydrogenase family)